MLRIDHFVFATADLAHGTRWMREALGLVPRGRGQHAEMGTWNRLWRVGSAYLEVIAIDPDAAPPSGPRWFGLDTPETQRRIAEVPRLVAWVAAVPDLAATRAALPVELGAPRRFRRDALSWQLTVPEDGVPLFGGALPALIAWDEGSTPPSETLPDDGLAIESFRVSGPPELAAALAAMGAPQVLDGIDPADDPGLALVLQSPNTGRVHLSSGAVSAPQA